MADDGQATDPGALVGRIDRLRGRVDALLALVDGLEERPAETDAAVDRLQVPTTTAGAGATGGSAPPQQAPDPPREAVPPPERAPTLEPAPTPEPVPPSGTATLVARELLASGMTREDVLRRLRESYGVAEPDAALRAAG